MHAQTPHYHPDQFLLADYSAGSVAPAVALPMAVHLEYCPHCRTEHRQLTDLGACLFENLDAVPVADTLLDKVINALDRESATAPRVAPLADTLPRALRGYLGNGIDLLDWEKQGKALKVARLGFGDPDREVALHHLRAGSRAPEHGHRGLEITVVLQGGFSDADGNYRAGDFVIRGPGEIHRPVAWSDGPCLTLSVQDGPIRFEGLFSRLLNPFIKLRPR